MVEKNTDLDLKALTEFDLDLGALAEFYLDLGELTEFDLDLDVSDIKIDLDLDLNFLSPKDGVAIHHPTD